MIEGSIQEKYVGFRVDVPPGLTLKLASAGNMAEIQRASRSAINLD